MVVFLSPHLPFHMEKINMGAVCRKGIYDVSIQALPTGSKSYLHGFSQVTLEHRYSMVTFSVYVLCDMVVSMEFPLS